MSPPLATTPSPEHRAPPPAAAIDDAAPAIDEAELHCRQRVSQRGFHRALARSSPGAQTIEAAGGIQATIVPPATRMPLLNCVFYDDAEALMVSLDELADGYRRAGVDGYAVWVPPWDRPTARALRDAGPKRGGVLEVSAAVLADLDLEPRRELELDLDPTPEMVAWCNDQAHGVQAEQSLIGALSADAGRRRTPTTAGAPTAQTAPAVREARPCLT